MKRIGLLVLGIVVLLVFSFKASYALFNSEATSANNTFTAAAVFPSTSPSITPSVTPGVSEVPISTTPTPSPIPGEPYVDKVIEVNGTYGHCCSDLSSNTTDAEAFVKGAPDSPPNSNFIQISDGSTVTMKFEDNKALPSGNSNPDIRLYVYDTLFPGTAKVEVSQDGSIWKDVGNHLDTSNVNIDIDPTGLSFVKFIRLTDLGGPDTTFLSLGFDLDAIEALNSQIDP